MSKTSGKAKGRTLSTTAPSTYVIDGQYVRRQIREAVKTFVAPATGIYEAITGTERYYVSRDASTGRLLDKKD